MSLGWRLVLRMIVDLDNPIQGIVHQLYKTNCHVMSYVQQPHDALTPRRSSAPQRPSE